MQVHGLLHLLGFDHEISDEAEAEMEEEEELLLKSLGWKGKGLIQSANDAETNGMPHIDNPDGNFIVINSLLTTTFAKKASSWIATFFIHFEAIFACV